MAELDVGPESLDGAGFEAVVVAVGRVKTGGGTLENTGGGGARDGIMRGGGGRLKAAELYVWIR